MTRPLYRLAAIDSAGEPCLAIEIGGAHYRLDALLDAGARQRLGAAPDLMALLADWPFWDDRLAGLAAAGMPERVAALPAETLRFRAPIACPAKLICIGSNYHDHIAEMKIPMLPTYPYAFIKPASNTIRASGEAVAIPRIASMTDWEAELAVVIGRTAKDVPAEQALDVVAGYANINDLSARDWLADRPAVGIDWVRHKAFDGFAPFGPYLVPARFVPDPQDLPIRLSVNGVVKQDSNTGRMVFGVAPIIAHLSTIMTLEPGDVIATGTPAGVGHGRAPQEFLKPGDHVEIEIGPLGVLATPMT